MFEELTKFGQADLKNPDSTELSDYVESLPVDEIISSFSEKLFSSDTPQAINYLLLGFTEKKSSTKKRFKVCQEIIKKIHDCEFTNRIGISLIGRIAQELGKFSAKHLVAIAENCLEFIRSSTSNTQPSWKDLLPKVLCEIESHKDVEYAGSEMSGTDFKQRIVQVICSTSWSPGIVPSLAAMFTEIQLSEEEHLQVVNKLCNFFNKMAPEEIPPLIHQMLILCKNQHGVIIFLSLRRFFSSNIYNREELSTNVDSITHISDTGDSKEMVECESTVLYHIEEAAKISRGCVSDLLKFAKSCIHTPEIILDPFLLAVLLSLSTISAYEQQVMETLKGTIACSVAEEDHRQNSAWLRSLVPVHRDFNNILALFIQSNVIVRDRVLKGMVHFCMALLNIPPSKTKEAAVEKLWSYGKHSLVCIVKKHRQVAKTVLQTLADKIITGMNVSQYTGCLVKLCNVAPLVIIDNLPVMLRLLDFLGFLPLSVARCVINAVICLIQISTKLRDGLILVLRKALFSRELETRKIAVIGFLQLLKVLKVKGLAALSQSEQTLSGPSFFTQICMEVHTQSSFTSSSSNEAICLEVLGVLRRCFMQQAPVKACLYQGLYDALCRNPELTTSVLDLLLAHFNQFYNQDPTTLPPLEIKKAITIQGADIVLQEPVGQLVFVMQQIALKALQLFDEDEQPRSLEKLKELLDSMVTRYAQCDLQHFELDEGTNFLDILPETLQLQETVRQTIGVYQALMAYTVCSWTAACDATQGRKLTDLFKAHTLLVDYVKNCKPSKKEAGKKDKDKEKDRSGMLKKAPLFKLPETVLDLRSVIRLLTLLLSEDVPWATDESIEDVRSRRPLLRYAAQVALEVVTTTKSHIAVCKSASLLKLIIELAKLLYERCLKRYNDMAQFESSASVPFVECFYQLLDMLFSSINNFSSALAEIVSMSADKDSAHILRPVIKTFQQLLVDMVSGEEEEEHSPEDKHLLSIVISALSLLTTHLSPDNPYTIKLVDWMIDFAQKRSLPTNILAKSYLTMLFTLISKVKPESSLLDSLALQLSHLFGSINEVDVEESPQSLAVVTDTTMTTALPQLCAGVIASLDNVDWLLLRLKAELAVVTLPTTVSASPTSSREGVLHRERSAVHQLGLCVNVTQSISCIAVPAGPCTEAVFRLLSRSYATLTALTKYFNAKCSPQHPNYQNARFGKLVKLAGSHLSSQVADLILYVEELDKDKKVKESQALSLARKQAVYIPRLVADLENFSKAVTQLSKKCKDDSLLTNMKLTTTRDFRINTKKLQEVLRRNNEVGSDDEEAEVSRVQPTQVNTSRARENTTQADVSLHPPSKRRRKQ